MHIIKPCPHCGIKLRFPINAGKVKVKCRCGYSFLADPDDPKLYAEATFDLSLKKKPKTGLQRTSIVKTIIETLYSYWYTLGNFTLLPTRDKIKVIAVAAGIVVLILIIAYCVFFRQSQLPQHGIVI